MPISRNVKAFLGLIGYYRNHINHYVDMTHTLKTFVRKDGQYSWTESYERAFKELKICLQRPAILVCPDPSKLCYFFTDASKYC